MKVYRRLDDRSQLELKHVTLNKIDNCGYICDLITATGMSPFKIKNKKEESTVFLECLSSRKTFYIYSLRCGVTRWDGWINGLWLHKCAYVCGCVFSLNLFTFVSIELE
jgi:hypothetical protein